jgi:hypothetical protein
MDNAFSIATSRLQVVILLSQLARQPELDIRQFATSSLFSSLLLSLQVDKSTTVFSVGIAVLIMIFPKLAIEAPEALNAALPRLFSILARVVCWAQAPDTVLGPGKPGGDLTDSSSETSSPLATERFRKTYQLVKEVEWSILGMIYIRRFTFLKTFSLESSFDLAARSPPDANLFFQFLYGLWPCNTLVFLRNPVEYLKSADILCPFVGGWEEVIDTDEIHSKMKVTR